MTFIVYRAILYLMVKENPKPNEGKQMRTTGEFSDIYNQARTYINDASNMPCNPVVRLEKSGWVLESDLELSDNALEITLNDFQSYWYEAMRDENYTPSPEDIEDMVAEYAE